MVVPRSQKEIDELEFRKIKMRIGIHERTFVKNVVAIGLSAGFIEPLESNGLFSVHTFLFSLIRALENKNISQWDRDNYNYHTNSIFRSLAEFISLHYSLSIRNDTQYWIDNTNRSFLSNINNEKNQSIFSDLSAAKNGIKKLEPMDAINYIAVGMNYMPVDDVSISIAEIQNNVKFERDFVMFSENLEANKKRWRDNARYAPSLYEYLKNNIHKEG
jgi:tryptophan halogenase